MAIVFAQLTVREVERVAVGLPYHRFSYNAGADVVGGFNAQVDVFERADDEDGVGDVDGRRNGARSRRGHLKTNPQGVGHIGTRSAVGVGNARALALLGAVYKPFKLGRVAAALDVDGRYGNGFVFADGVASRTKLNVGMRRYVIYHRHHKGVGSGRVVLQRAAVRAVFGAVVRVEENGLDAVARFEREGGPQAVFAAYEVGNGAVVVVPLIYRCLAFVGRTHVVGYRVVGADFGARVGVDVYHHAVLLDNLNDDDVRVNLGRIGTEFVAGEAATDVAEVAQLGGFKYGVGGTRHIAAVDGPLILRVGTGVLHLGYKAGVDTTALGYHRGVFGREARTRDGDGGMNGIAHGNRYRVVGRAGLAARARTRYRDGKARGFGGTYKPVFLLAEGVGVEVLPHEGRVVLATEVEVCPLTRRKVFTQDGVVARVYFGFYLHLNRSRVVTTIGIYGGHLEFAFLPYRYRHRLLGFAAVQPLVGLNARAARRKGDGLRAAQYGVGSRNLAVGLEHRGHEGGVDVGVGRARVGGGYYATNGVVGFKTAEV